ncbi:hypothetical protein RND81_11G030300 [Saponaria officinalis]|uniref:Glycine-rich protein n=1 Tax=Saponaria officinalis TaxID=3572 RepID=A0AAW1HHG7_SAPOF
MATPSTTDATTTATTVATSTTSDGPVLSVIAKRLRALRKKLNRITQMEDSLSQGKTLNSEQLDVLRSKPAVVAVIDELEKLRAPLSSALDDELSLAPPPPPPPQPQQQSPQNNDNANGDNETTTNDVVKELVKLMYFGSLFDVKPQSEFTSLMLTRTLERGCCLTYDYVTDDANDDLLGERDLDSISTLQGLMIARPAHSTLSHQNALEQCFEYALLWLQNSNQPIDPQSDVTYAALREKLNKIMSSDYFTALPEMKGPGEVAAAAAVANFGSFQVPVHESMAKVEVPIQVEGSTEQYQETQENAANNEEHETSEQQSGSVAEFHKSEPEPENPPEVVSVPTDQEQYQNAEGEHDYRNVDLKDQQYVPRRGQRGGRGAGDVRRGYYSNGRGGRGTGRSNGPYQNGRNQYYDNYYPRNYYNRRGRGGFGGGRGGGDGYYNNSSGSQANHTQADIGVES